MTTDNKTRRVLVTGGGTFLGDNIAAALLAEGAEVTLLVRPGGEERLGPMLQRVRWWRADLWDPASLRGRARGHGLVIHTVGSMTADPAMGLTLHRLNVVSARNAVTMCISDGVQQMMLISAANAPWLNRRYVRAKREAEEYLGRVGIQGTVIRAPIVYVRGYRRPVLFRLMSLLGRVPPLSWLGLNRIAPLPIDVLARGVARLALEPSRSKTIYYAPDLRKRNRRDDIPLSSMPILSDGDTPPSGMRPVSPFDALDEDTPFGWSPPDRR